MTSRGGARFIRLQRPSSRGERRWRLVGFVIEANLGGATYVFAYPVPLTCGSTMVVLKRRDRGLRVLSSGDGQ